MLSEWNKFVSKIYQEGKKKNSNYKFKDALSDASARKGEMGKSGPGMGSVGMKTSRKSCMKKCKTMCKTKKMRGGKRRRGGRSRRRRGGSSANRPLMPASFPDDSNAP
jgi:hypothetical protein